MLADEKERDQQETLFRDYVGQALWEANYALYKLGGVTYEKKQYIELAHPEIVKKQEMSAAEIKQYILDKLSR